MKPKNGHKGSLDRAYVTIDLETGGLNEEQNAIMEIAAVVVKFDKKLKKYVVKKDYSFDSLILPYNKKLTYESKALEVNKISMKELKSKGNKAKSVLKLLIQLAEALNPGNDIRNKPVIVGHNIADFDFRFLSAFFENFGMKIEDYFAKAMFDTLYITEIMMSMQTHIGDRRLGTVTNYFGISIHEKHRAMGDAIGTALLFCKFCNILCQERSRKELLSI